MQIDVTKLGKPRQKKPGVMSEVWTGFVDWRFEHRVTPSIIRFTWVVLLVFGIAAICWATYSAVIAAQVQFAVDTAWKNANAGQSVPSQPFRVEMFHFGPMEITATSFVVLLLGALWLRVAMESLVVKR